MKRLTIWLVVFLALLPSLALASDITSAEYKSTIVVTNSSSNTTNVAVPFTLSTAGMISDDMLAADALDCAMQDGGGNDVAFMPGNNSTNPWVTFVSTIGTLAQINRFLYSKGATGGTIRYFPADAGMSVADNNTSIGESNNMTVTVSGFMDTVATGSYRHIFIKGNVWKIYHSDTTSGTIYGKIEGGTPTVVSATGINSSDHTVALTIGTTWVALYIDGVPTDNETLADSIANNGNAWQFCPENSITYMQYASLSFGGNLKGYWSWTYDTVFYDQSGNGNTATPTFRTSSSDADVSASVSSQVGLIPGSAVSSNTSTIGWTMITTVPTAPTNLYTEGIYTYPGAALVTAWALSSGNPPAAFHLSFAFGLALLAMVLVFGATHNVRMGQRGSLILALLAGVLVDIYFYTTGAVPGWTLIPYGLIGITLVLWRKSPSPVD